ncbi:MAG: hypothetical protein Q9160_002067 [Pyrenula sp. 1 TL-2023]
MTAAATSSSFPSTSTDAPPLPTSPQSRLDLLISLHLHIWPALTLALTNSWGGPSSDDKRDWFAGAISELLSPPTPALRDVEDLEDVLAQVMSDEFEVVVEDGSLEEVAMGIWSGREELGRGDVERLRGLWEGWWERRGKKEGIVINKRDGEEGSEEDDSEGDEEDEDEDEDEDMDEAPELVRVEEPREKKKPEPEVDEDGFTKVVGKRGKR